MSVPRQARDALRAFSRLDAALDEATTPSEAEPSEAARAAFLLLRRVLVDLGAPDAPVRGVPPLSPAYVLTAYADEALIHLRRWPGAAVWPGMLLERAIWGGEVAGERLVEAAEAMAALRAPATRDAAAALYLVFALGFRGGLRDGPDGEARAARLTAALYDLAMERPVPQGLDLRGRFAQTLAHTRAAPRRPRRRPVERAVAALGLVAIAWLVTSHLMWSSTHAEVARRADAVIDAAAGSGL